MNKNLPIKELAQIIAKRSTCNVKVGAVIFDSHGIFAWGWNHAGPRGYGICAERHAIMRANKRRLCGASIATVSLRRNKIICSNPCCKCFSVIMAHGLDEMFYHDVDKNWMRARLSR